LIDVILFYDHDQTFCSEKPVMASVPRIDAERLIDFGAAVYASAGMPEADARIRCRYTRASGSVGTSIARRIAARMVSRAVAEQSDETCYSVGGPSSTQARLPSSMVTTASARCSRPMRTRDAIKRAKAHGIGAVGLRNSNHFGTCMYYTRMAALEGCVMIMTTNGGPAMAPWGGRKKIIGTNPWSVAAPAGRHPPLIMDMANTSVARGKIYLARQKREPDTARLGDQCGRRANHAIRRLRSTASFCRWRNTKAMR
jgi:hypothetical protein